MNRIRRQLSSRLTSIILVAALGGCVSTFSGPPGPEIPVTPMPGVEVGQSFVYSDGSRETVIAVRGDQVTWQNRTGIIRESTHNPIIPYHSWKSSTRRAHGWIEGNPDLLWPMKIGKSGRFDLYRDVENSDGTNKRRYHQRWHCDVSETKTIKWKTRTSDAFVVKCDRYYNGTWRQRRFIDYVPSLGAVVAVKNEYRSTPSTLRKLVELEFDTSILEKDERTSLFSIVQQVLLDSGPQSKRVWRASSRTLGVTIQSLDHFKRSDGQSCQHYVGIFKVQNRVLENYRTACRDQSGTWVQG